MRMSEPHQKCIVLGGNRARTSGFFGGGLKATQTGSARLIFFVYILLSATGVLNVGASTVTWLLIRR
ncbi:hypothetical protein AA042_08195 [Pseudomonas lundensis]|jgi:hypothetical protein|nr:hypothetical protein AA042_08195 [Pseudomonas lundensis]